MTSAQDILDRVRGISPLPDTVTRLISVLNDPASSIDEIIEVIRYDDAITTQMLKLCNSAYFGLSRQVHSLSEAIRYLGTVKVLQLLMAVHGNSLLARGQNGYGLDPGVLWRHSVAVSLASAALGQRVSLDNVSLASTAGLLHDIGKVVLNEYVAEEFAEIVRILTEQKTSFVEAERQVLGFSHEEIGAMVAEKWQLPDPIIRCIRYHHEPSSIDLPEALVDVIYLSNCVCLLLGIGLGADGLLCRADPDVMTRLALRESDLESIGAQVLSDLQQVELAFAGAALTPRAAAPNVDAGSLS